MGILRQTDAHYVLSSSFDFVRSVGSQILPIRLQDGQELNAKVLKHITGTSPIYVRAQQIINGKDDVRLLFHFFNYVCT